MPLYALTPLDIQTETLSRDQQPKARMLVGILLIAVVGVSLSWLSHRQHGEAALYPEGPHGPGGVQVALVHLRGR